MVESADTDILAQKAIAVRKNAYAEYSKFTVGAAVECGDGSIFSGCNVENASYGLTICAERVALCNAVAAGHRKFERIAIATAGGFTPCGACRQFMAEFAADLNVTLIDTSNNSIRVLTLAELLPHGFRLNND